MTDPTQPLTDEDLSAVVDGEATPDVVARVQADPSARARLEAFRAAATSIGQTPVPPLDPTTVDGLIARAIHESEEVAPEPDSAHDAVVAPLPSRRGGRGAPPWLVAAGIAVLVAIGLGLVWSGTRSDPTDTVASGSSADSAEESAAVDRGEAEVTGEDGRETDGDASAGEQPTLEGPGSTPSDGAAGVDDLGPFADADALRSALATAFPPADQLTVSTTPADDASLVRCDQLSRAVLEITGGPTRQALATVAGDPVFVFEYERASFADETTPTTVVTAVAPASCDQLLTFER